MKSNVNDTLFQLIWIGCRIGEAVHGVAGMKHRMHGIQFETIQIELLTLEYSCSNNWFIEIVKCKEHVSENRNNSGTRNVLIVMILR